MRSESKRGGEHSRTEVLFPAAAAWNWKCVWATEAEQRAAVKDTHMFQCIRWVKQAAAGECRWDYMMQSGEVIKRLLSALGVALAFMWNTPVEVQLQYLYTSEIRRAVPERFLHFTLKIMQQWRHRRSPGCNVSTSRFCKPQKRLLADCQIRRLRRRWRRRWRRYHSSSLSHTSTEL